MSVRFLGGDGYYAGREPARWECAEGEDCDRCGQHAPAWGGHGGETRAQNLRRTKAAAREHTEETGHSTTVVTVVGVWESRTPTSSRRDAADRLAEAIG